MVEASVITYNEKGTATSFVGPKAINVYRCAALISALGLAKAGIGLGRGLMNKTQLLKAATTYTDKPYKRGEYDKARADLKEVLAACKADKELIHKVA